MEQDAQAGARPTARAPATAAPVPGEGEADQKQRPGAPPRQREPGDQQLPFSKISARWLVASLLFVLLVGCAIGFFVGKGIPNLFGTARPTQQPGLVAGVSPRTPSPQLTQTSLPTSTPTTRKPTSTPKATPTVPTLTPTPRLTLPFEDNFDRALKPEWEILEGDWRVINDQLSTLSRNKEWSHILVGEPSWRDYAVQVDANLARGGQGMRVLVRVQDSDNMMAFYVRRHYGESGWWIKRDGEWHLLQKE